MAAVGALLGVFGGILYTKLALWALGGVWRGASTGVDFQFFAESSAKSFEKAMEESAKAVKRKLRKHKEKLVMH